MAKPKRIQVLSGILVVAALVAAVVLYTNGRPQKPEPSAPGYYTGPMKSKGDPNLYGNEEGQKVAPPPDAGKHPAPPIPKATKPGPKGEEGNP